MDNDKKKATKNQQQKTHLAKADFKILILYFIRAFRWFAYFFLLFVRAVVVIQPILKKIEVDSRVTPFSV